MFSEDYILRMINQAVAVLLKLAGFRQAKQYTQAQQAIDQSLEELLGLRADLLKPLDDEVIFRMLTLQDQLDVERAAVIADLFKAEGDILADQDLQAESKQSYLRALNFYLEVGLSGQNTPDMARLFPKITALAGQLSNLPLPDEYLWGLYVYYESLSEYNRAEAALTELASRPGQYSEIRDELIAFYQRILALPPAELAKAQLQREQIQAKLDKVGGRHPPLQLIRT